VKNKPRILLFVIIMFSLIAYGAVRNLYEKEKIEYVQKVKGTVRQIHKEKRKIEFGEWLSLFPEKGQTFEQYLISDPVVPSGDRKYIYIRPIGKFNDKQLDILKLTAEFMGIYFNLPVKIRPIVSLDVVPTSAMRKYARRSIQVWAPYILNDILIPELPLDAVVSIALTSSDLYPEESWNYVFGLAYLKKRVGVFSMYRYGDPEKSAYDFKRVLLRTLKLATHETGHMFSIDHCKAFECNMNGSLSLPESDRNPLWLCPEDLAKLSYGVNFDSIERYKKLADFCKKNGLGKEYAFYKKSIKILEREGIAAFKKSSEK